MQPTVPRSLSTPAARAATVLATATSGRADSARASDPDPVRVLLVDDYPCVCGYLRGVLDDIPELAGFICVGEAATAREALRLAQEREADLVVLDLALPDGDGLAVARALRARRPEIHLLVFTGRVDRAQAAALVRLGVEGYLSKEAELTEVVTALRAVAAGRLYLADAARDAAATALAGGGLTAHERRVLALLLDGHGTRAIAAQLHITPRTVGFHLTHLYAKAGVSSRSELICRAQPYRALLSL